MKIRTIAWTTYKLVVGVGIGLTGSRMTFRILSELLKARAKKLKEKYGQDDGTDDGEENDETE